MCVPYVLEATPVLTKITLLCSPLHLLFAILAGFLGNASVGFMKVIWSKSIL